MNHLGPFTKRTTHWALCRPNEPKAQGARPRHLCSEKVFQVMLTCTVTPWDCCCWADCCSAGWQMLPRLRAVVLCWSHERSKRNECVSLGWRHYACTCQSLVTYGLRNQKEWDRCPSESYITATWSESLRTGSEQHVLNSLYLRFLLIPLVCVLEDQNKKHTFPWEDSKTLKDTFFVILTISNDTLRTNRLRNAMQVWPSH